MLKISIEVILFYVSVTVEKGIPWPEFQLFLPKTLKNV
jgi:hypothetical protein